MKNKSVIVSVTILLITSCLSFAEIDPYNTGAKYAYGENVGWFNFNPAYGGLTFNEGKVEGFIWQENIGWVNFSPVNYGGVTYDNQRRLGGYAWGENVGWIKFDHDYGQVTADWDGNFSGWAWGENIGWVHLNSTSPVAYNVQAAVVNYHDLANFADDWLLGRSVANLNNQGNVDFLDYSILASYWLDFAPAYWPLKY